jgi:hypothetical protein
MVEASKINFVRDCFCWRETIDLVSAVKLRFLHKKKQLNHPNHPVRISISILPLCTRHLEFGIAEARSFNFMVAKSIDEMGWLMVRIALTVHGVVVSKATVAEPFSKYS